MVAQGQGDVGAGGGVLEGRGDGDGQEGWVVGLWVAQRVVVRQPDRRAFNG